MLDKVCKMALTIHEYINEVQDDRHSPPYFRVTGKRTEMVRRATRKFLSYMKDSKYRDAIRAHDITHYQVIKSHLQRDKDDSNSIYLTWLQMQLHQFIHDFCQEYDPNNLDSRPRNFYKETLEMLLR